RRAGLRDLLDCDERQERARAEPAVLLVDEDPEHPVLAEELDDVPRELRLLVDLRRARRNPLARERPHELPDLALLVVERIERHVAKANRTGGTRPRRRLSPRRACGGSRLRGVSRAG